MGRNINFLPEILLLLGVKGKGGPSGAEDFGRRSGKDGDEGNTGGGSGVLAGGVVTGVEIALSNEGNESGEGTFVEADPVRYSRRFDGCCDAARFFASGPAINVKGGVAPAQMSDEVGFECAGYAFGFVLTDAEADAGLQTALRALREERGATLRG